MRSDLCADNGRDLCKEGNQIFVEGLVANEFVWKQAARYQLGELSDIVVRFSESITCLTLSPTNSKVMGY